MAEVDTKVAGGDSVSSELRETSGSFGSSIEKPVPSRRSKLVATILGLTVLFGMNKATGNLDFKAVAETSERPVAETVSEVKIAEPLTVINEQLADQGIDAAVELDKKIELDGSYELSPVIDMMFSSERGEYAARELGIHAADYFVLGPEAADSIGESSRWAQDERLLPVFTPAIYKYQSQIETAAEEFGVPANFIAMIMQIETNGYERAHSSADAYGLMQIVPRYHLQRFADLGYLPENASYEDFKAANAGKKSQVSKQEYLAALYNPEASIKAGAQYLSELIASSRRHFKDLPPDHPTVYARAAMAYNGGGSQIRRHESKVPDESANYGVAVQRMIIDSAIASRLREAGLDDGQIFEAMKPSEEMDALIFSVRSLHLNKTSNKNARALGYEDIKSFIEGDEPPAVRMAYDLFKNAGALLRSYKKSGDTYAGSAYDASYAPGLMLKLQMEGLGLYFKAGNGEQKPPWER